MVFARWYVGFALYRSLLAPPVSFGAPRRGEPEDVEALVGHNLRVDVLAR